MLCVYVEFEIHVSHIDDFVRAIVANARLSRQREAGCRQFDVLRDPQHPAVVVLYELYDDRPAFDAHLASEHFRAFDAASAGWVAAKRVRLLERIEPAGS